VAWAERVRRAGPHAAAVALRTGALLLALTLLYLGVTNLVLASGVIQHLANESHDVRITYASAYSLWPGRVVVRNLGVRLEDHNVQIWVGVPRGTLEVDLLALARRRLHLLRVDGEEVTYRMRHKLSRVGKEGPRVAAYPPIQGFADPPLFSGPAAEPSPGSPGVHDDAWDVDIEHVTALVAEVWILEYRYRGPGVARGSFRVLPARFYEVARASLDLAGGELTLGSKLVAARATAKIRCNVAGSDPRKLEGLEPLAMISARVSATLAGSEIAFLDAYLVPHVGLSAAGRGDATVRVVFDHGSIAPGTSVAVVSPDASLGNETLRARGRARFTLEGPSVARGPLTLGFSGEQVVLTGPSPERRPGPVAERLVLSAELASDLSRPLEVVAARVAESKVDVPDLRWLDAFVGGKGRPSLAGRGLLTVEARRLGKGRVRGSLRVEGADVTVRLRDGVSEPSRLTLTTKAAFDLGAHARGEAKTTLHVERAAALLPLVSDSALLRAIASKLLGLGALDARGELAVADTLRFDLLDARAGIARARGQLESGPSGPHGAFLVSTPAANLGVRVGRSGTTLRPFVDDDWLARNTELRGRGGLARAERGGLSL
jgi:hypothetical protein